MAPCPEWLIWPKHLDRLRQLDVVLLGGGTSEEREVSLRSADSMAAALLSLDERSTRSHLQSLRRVEIDAQGAWVVGGQSYKRDEALRRLAPRSVFLLALHGGEGENGQVQNFLAERGAIYTGSDPDSSALCMDKTQACTRVRTAGMACAPGVLFRPSPWNAELALRDCLALGAGPWFVKPNCGGSSLGVVRIQRAQDLPGAIEALLQTGQDVLVEQEIRGLEVSVGVLGTAGSSTQALPLCEIQPERGNFFDYSEKYDAGGATETCPPAHTSPESAVRVQQLACEAFDLLRCDGYARVDFILQESDGTPVFLEANTLPGMTQRSLLPLAARAAGVDLGSLCLEILARALTGARPSSQS